MKKPILTSSLVVLALALGAGTAIAKGGPGGKSGFRGQMDFETMDTNGDGKITQEDLAAKAEERFKAADTDGDGKLSAEEMKAGAEGRRAERMQARMDRMIERLDTDGDGLISLQEIQSTERGGRFFERLDKDGDGGVTAEEFEAAKADFKSRKGHGGKKGHRQN